MVRDRAATRSVLTAGRQLGRDALRVSLTAVHGSADMGDPAVVSATSEGTHLPHTRSTFTDRRHSEDPGSVGMLLGFSRNSRQRGPAGPALRSGNVQAGDGACDHQALDLTRAFEDRVAHGAS